MKEDNRLFKDLKFTNNPSKGLVYDKPFSVKGESLIVSGGFLGDVVYVDEVKRINESKPND